MVDESTTFSGKSVLVVCLRSALADAEPETFFWELIELDGITADDRKGFNRVSWKTFERGFFKSVILFLTFFFFACDGASVMLGKRTGVATQGEWQHVAAAVSSVSGTERTVPELKVHIFMYQ